MTANLRRVASRLPSPVRDRLRAASDLAPRPIRSIDEPEPLQPGAVDVNDLLDRLGVEDLSESADEYYINNLGGAEYYFAKPFGSTSEAPDYLITFGQVLAALQLAPGMRVLDFGAGTGWTSRYLSQLGCEVFVSDVSETALGMARELYERLPPIGQRPSPVFQRFDGHRIDLHDASVDRVLCFDALHHTPNPAHVLAELGRVLRPGGRAAFSEPGPNHSKTYTKTGLTSGQYYFFKIQAHNQLGYGPGQDSNVVLVGTPPPTTTTTSTSTTSTSTTSTTTPPPQGDLWGVDSYRSIDVDAIAQVRQEFGEPEFWIRYLENDNSLTPEEITLAHSEGFAVGLIDQNFGTDNLVGYESGAGFAESSVGHAQDLGAPEGTLIYADIEGNATIDTDWIIGWFDGIVAGGYTPGYYADMDESSNFEVPYCDAVAANGDIGTMSPLWANTPSQPLTTAAEAPPYGPSTPPCTGTVSAWQYAIAGEHPVQVDEDLIDPGLLSKFLNPA